MSHDRTYPPQIYCIELGLSPRMRGAVKQLSVLFVAENSVATSRTELAEKW
jgi:hypothetical protein